MKYLAECIIDKNIVFLLLKQIRVIDEVACQSKNRPVIRVIRCCINNDTTRSKIRDAKLRRIFYNTYFLLYFVVLLWDYCVAFKKNKYFCTRKDYKNA